MEQHLLERERERRTFYGLDALRGVAAIVVVSRHAPALFGLSLFPGSALGVDLFFVLSGFVIAHAYDKRIACGLGPGEFMTIRLIRLYPLYLLGTLIGAAVAIFTLGSGVFSATGGYAWRPFALGQSLVLSTFLLPTPAQSPALNSLYPLDAVAWSLAFELVVNALYAAFHRYLTTLLLAGVMAVDAVLLLAAVLHNQTADLGWNWSTVAAGLARVFYSFPAGVLLYRLSDQGRRRASLSVIWPLLAALSIFLIGLPGQAQNLFSVLAIVILFPAIVLVAARARMPAWAVRVCALLGVTSYAVYALHRPLLSVVNGMAQVLHVRIAALAPFSGMVFVAALLGLSWLVDLYYDQPVRQWLTIRSRRPAVAGLPATTSRARL